MSYREQRTSRPPVADEVFYRHAGGQEIALAKLKDARGGFRRGVLSLAGLGNGLGGGSAAGMEVGEHAGASPGCPDVKAPTDTGRGGPLAARARLSGFQEWGARPWVDRPDPAGRELS